VQLNAGNQSGILYSLLTANRPGKFGWGFIVLLLFSFRLLSSTVKLRWPQKGIGYWFLSHSSKIEVKLIFEIEFKLSVMISRLNINFKFYTAGNDLFWRILIPGELEFRPKVADSFVRGVTLSRITVMAKPRNSSCGRRWCQNSTWTARVQPSQSPPAYARAERPYRP
jgi:hypothetical protein